MLESDLSCRFLIQLLALDFDLERGNRSFWLGALGSQEFQGIRGKRSVPLL